MYLAKYAIRKYVQKEQSLRRALVIIEVDFQPPWGLRVVPLSIRAHCTIALDRPPIPRVPIPPMRDNLKNVASAAGIVVVESLPGIKASIAALLQAPHEPEFTPSVAPSSNSMSCKRLSSLMPYLTPVTQFTPFHHITNASRTRHFYRPTSRPRPINSNDYLS